MEPLNNSSMNYSEDEKEKCDFSFSPIFNGLSATEYGGTSLCHGSSCQSELP